MSALAKATYNVYCDESRHLPHDQQPVMLIGAVWCHSAKAKEAAGRLREIKQKHKLKPMYELKWSKVSRGQAAFFQDVLDYFFDDDDLHFRAAILRKTANPQTVIHDHDGLYYQMYFTMLQTMLRPDGRYRIYVDYKDTKGAAKIRNLHQLLCDSLYDFNKHVVERVQLVRSHEVQLIQLADFLLGAVGYANLPAPATQRQSETKLALVERTRHRSKYQLTRSTLPREEKINLRFWQMPRAEEA